MIANKIKGMNDNENVNVVDTQRPDASGNSK